MKSRRIRLVETSVERTARMLSKAYNIRVVWKGTDAFTDGRTIHLPIIPDNAPDEFVEAVQGYLDHEVAHVLFSDFNLMSVDSLTELQFECVNIVEDVRVEAAICQVFPGSAYNLRKTHSWIMNSLAKSWEQIPQFRKAILAYFVHEKYSKTDEFYQTVVDPTTKDIVELCVQAVGSYDTIKSPKDAMDGGLRLFEVLKDFLEDEGASGEEESKTRANPDGTPVITSMGEIGRELARAAKALVSLNGNSGYQHNQEEPTYLVYSTAGDTVDKIEPVESKESDVKLSQLRNDCSQIVNVLKTRLVNSLRTRTSRKWLSGREEGKLDSRKLHHAVMGTSSALYKQRTERLSLDTAVGLAIDHSGSMCSRHGGGEKLALAGKAAIVLGDVLSTLRVPFMVYGYSARTPARENVPKDQELYARWAEHWIRYYHDFSDNWNNSASLLTTVDQNGVEGTLDGESVLHGVRRLLARPEKRKILFVLNDGMPNPGHGHIGRCQQHLHDVIAAAQAAGVEIIGFGIQSTAVKQYYPNHVVIHALSDLVAEPLIVLDRLLRGGVTAK